MIGIAWQQERIAMEVYTLQYMDAGDSRERPAFFKTNSMTNYVCGFYFDDLLQRVVLIWKEKPQWQKGKLNGVGGKIEPGETPEQAMRREFKEETGIDHKDWYSLVILIGGGWCVYFYYAVANPNHFEYAETQEAEEVAKIEIDRLLAWDYQHIKNLDWLIPMALHKIQHPEEKIMIDLPVEQ